MFKEFDETLKESHLFPLTATGIDIFQINFGRLCNQACKHCHVGAGPNRKEVISKDILKTCLNILSKMDIPTVDITGGTPELNSNFRWFVGELKKINKHIIVRCNLTVIFEQGQGDIPEFYRNHEVEIIASLPYYLEKNVDKQRGTGIFRKSISALKKLNDIGYGIKHSKLTLNLVYNPGGAFLPPSQSSIEKDFKHELGKRYGIQFNQLLTIANMPLGRFLILLRKTGNYETYMHRLIDAYNPEAAEGVMCRYTLSVGWDGMLYDCDFNQMLGLNCNHGAHFQI